MSFDGIVRQSTEGQQLPGSSCRRGGGATVSLLAAARPDNPGRRCRPRARRLSSVCLSECWRVSAASVARSLESRRATASGSGKAAGSVSLMRRWSDQSIVGNAETLDTIPAPSPSGDILFSDVAVSNPGGNGIDITGVNGTIDFGNVDISGIGAGDTGLNLSGGFTSAATSVFSALSLIQPEQARRVRPASIFPRHAWAVHVENHVAGGRYRRCRHGRAIGRQRRGPARWRTRISCSAAARSKAYRPSLRHAGAYLVEQRLIRLRLDSAESVRSVSMRPTSSSSAPAPPARATDRRSTI